MMQHIIDNIWIGNWQDAVKHQSVFEIFTVAKDSPFIGDYFYPLVDGPYSENKRLLYRAIFDLVTYRSNNSGIVLVHCISGISRSSATIGGYMISKGYTTEDAITYIKSIRPSANPVPEFIRLMKEYEINKNEKIKFTE